MSRLQPVPGTEIIDDIRLGHTWHEYLILQRFVRDQHPSVFIEIGVHEGGLSHLFLKEFPLMQYIGVEIDRGIVRPEVVAQYNERSTAQLMYVNCFDPSVKFILDALKDKIVYCDGGYKAIELEHFKFMCHSGDIIMAHDFWDGVRVPVDVPPGAWTPEVLLENVTHLDKDPTFIRLDEEIFKETRIVGWKKL